MKKHIVSYIFFLTAVIDVIVSILNFSSNNMSTGVTYLILAIPAALLGLHYRKKENKLK